MFNKITALLMTILLLGTSQQPVAAYTTKDLHTAQKIAGAACIVATVPSLVTSEYGEYATARSMAAAMAAVLSRATESSDTFTLAATKGCHIAVEIERALTSILRDRFSTMRRSERTFDGTSSPLEEEYQIRRDHTLKRLGLLFLREAGSFAASIAATKATGKISSRLARRAARAGLLALGQAAVEEGLLLLREKDMQAELKKSPKKYMQDAGIVFGRILLNQLILEAAGECLLRGTGETEMLSWLADKKADLQQAPSTQETAK